MKLSISLPSCLLSFLLLLSLAGCPGSLTIEGLDDALGDDDDSAGDDDDATGDDDDATGDDDDATGDDDDATGDDDDATGDDDDSTGEVDADGDGWNAAEDCDDNDAARNYDDADGDGSSTCEGDCNDGNAGVFPAATDTCDAVDQNCDGQVWGGEFIAHATTESEFSIWWFSTGAFMDEALDPPGDGRIYSVVVGDFNGDGALDTISARNVTLANGEDGAEADAMWGSCGDSSFTPENLTQTAGLDIGYWEEVFAANDVDGDGDLDVVGFDYRFGSGVTWLNEDGVGGAWSRRDESTGYDFEFNWTAQEVFPVESLTQPLVDIDGDGRADTVNCETDYNDGEARADCSIAFGEGDGTFSGWDDVFLLEREVNGVAVGDFNNDGVVDLLGGLDDDYNAGAGYLWLGDSSSPGEFSGNGQLVFDLVPTGSGVTNDPGYGWMTAYDFDGDGNLDVLASIQDSYGSEDREIHILYGDGTGGFAGVVEATTTPQWGGGDNVWLQDFFSVPSY